MDLIKKGEHMKAFISLLVFLSIFFLSEIYSQTDDFKCGLNNNPKEQGLTQTGSLYKPAMNGPGEYFRTLVVFVQFSGDTRTDDDWPLNSCLRGLTSQMNLLLFLLLLIILI